MSRCPSCQWTSGKHIEPCPVDMAEAAAEYRAQLTRALVAQQWVVACVLEQHAWADLVGGMEDALDTPAALAARILGEQP